MKKNKRRNNNNKNKKQTFQDETGLGDDLYGYTLVEFNSSANLHWLIERWLKKWLVSCKYPSIAVALEEIN